MKKAADREWAGLFFLLPSLGGVAVFMLIPFADVLRRSLTDAVGVRFVGLQNYRTVFRNGAFLLAAANTAKFTAVCIPLLLLLSLMTAVLLQRQKKAGQLLKSMCLVPMAIPVASVVLMWKLLFHKNGLINGVAAIFGAAGPDWMNTDAAFWVLVISYLWKNLGYDIVLWMAGLAGIPETIYEAARVDGAGEWLIFRKITLPNLLPSLYTISVLSLLNSFKVFREAYLVGGDYPQQSMYLLQHLYNNWFRELSLDKLSAAAVVSSGIIFLLILLLRRMWGKEEN